MIRILIQAGHNRPMQPGHETQTGTGGEAVFAAKMQSTLADVFLADGRFHVDAIPGLMPSPAWSGDVFLALHCDGAGPTAHGFGFGWPGNGRDPGRGPELAARVGKGFAAIPHPGGHHSPDNYTDGERGYYGWGHTTAPTKLLIEHGFMTNPSERVWLNGHIPEMAAATYAAVLEHVGLKTPAAVTLKFAPPWPVFTGATQIANGSLLNPLVIQRIRTVLKAAGRAAPYTAYVGADVVAHGKFWLPGEFTRLISAQLRAGRDVDVDHVVTIRTHKA